MDWRDRRALRQASSARRTGTSSERNSSLDFIVVVALTLRRKDYPPPRNYVTHPCRRDTINLNSY